MDYFDTVLEYLGILIESANAEGNERRARRIRNCLNWAADMESKF